MKFQNAFAFSNLHLHLVSEPLRFISFNVLRSNGIMEKSWFSCTSQKIIALSSCACLVVNEGWSTVYCCNYYNCWSKLSINRNDVIQYIWFIVHKRNIECNELDWMVTTKYGKIAFPCVFLDFHYFYFFFVNSYHFLFCFKYCLWVMGCTIAFRY